MFTSTMSALLSTRKRSLLTIVAWLVLAGVLILVSPSASEVREGGGGGAASADSSSVVASEQLEQLRSDVAAEAPAPTGAPGQDGPGAPAPAPAGAPAPTGGAASEESGPPAIVTVTADSAEATTAATVDVVTLLQQRDQVITVVSPLCADPSTGLRPGADCAPGSPEGTVSDDGTTRTVTAIMRGTPDDDGYREALETLRADLQTAAEQAASGAETHVTGPAGVSSDLAAAFGEADWILGAATTVIVLVILLAVYRSPVLAVLPLLVVAVALFAANAVAAWLAQASVIAITSQSTAILTVLLFGVGTDYALIVTSRYREELAAGAETGRADVHGAAMVRAMDRAGSALLSSAGTIVLALLALIVATTPTLREFGPYFAVGVVVLLLAGITLLPAAIVACGDAVFWPGGREKAVRRTDDGIWGKVADTVDRRPAAVLAGSLAVLLALTAGLAGYKESNDIVSGLRVESDARDGQAVIAEAIGPGEVSPEPVLLTADAGLTPETVAAAAAALPERLPGSVERATPGVVAPDGTAAELNVVLAHDPYGNEAMEDVAAIERELPDIVASGADGDPAAGTVAEPRAAAAGEAATNRDASDSVHRDLLVLLPLLLVVVGVVLGVLLRSVLAPVYLMVLQALGYAATMGATVIAAVLVGGDDGIGSQVPAYVLIFAIALGVDYTIFLMARYRQELDRHPPKEAMNVALTRTGGVVSSAGLILAATFAVLTVMPVRELFQFGIAMAIGILLDTFIVRPLMVPALVRMLGRHALWPATPAHDEPADDGADDAGRNEPAADDAGRNEPATDDAGAAAAAMGRAIPVDADADTYGRHAK
ncbi:MMPL family transporter [Corynebacterium sp.]|uniref:MMPL family transporter n=1 Tax=Corynebacterium sp. TaxID=1720 RepID=UPI0026DD352A|nr:MMPL family transporter [Corynebacterium sp.]MDO4610107.1 MMPL family transporter [Corynebacterium sp.]